MKGDETGTCGVVVHEALRMKRRRSLGRYLALYVVIVCGVAWGVLLVKWLSGSVEQAPGERLAHKAGQVASAVGSGLHTVGSDLHAVYREAVAKVTGEEPGGDRESRAASATGRGLAQQCENWRQAYEERQSPETQAEMDRACRRYRRFVETGDESP